MSSGVFAASRNHLRAEVVHGWQREGLSPLGLPGRVAARWRKLWQRVILASVNLVDSVGWGAQNTQIAHHVSALLQEQTRPWVVCLDANMSPEEFSAREHLVKLGGIVVAPAAGTCRHRDERRTLDYFYLGRRLRHQVARVDALGS